jgi:hypothetical protein
MEKRHQINPIVTEATRDLLRQEAQERKCSQGELVETALLAFLRPGEAPGTEGLLFARLLAMEEVLGQIMGLLQHLITVQEAQVKPEPPPIATYEQMYGPIDAAPAPAVGDAGEPAALLSPVPPRSRLRRWLRREASL